MAVLQPHEIERALVISAHPDDVDFGSAGTVANLTDAGAEVTYCLVTDGQAGGYDSSIARPKMAAIRRDEQTKAAAEVGVTNLCFLGHMDGEVEFNLELRHELSRVIRLVRPRVVIAQSPHINLQTTYGSHPDHVASGQAAFAAVYPDSRNPFAFPELLTSGYEPWSVDELWVTNHHEPGDHPGNVWVDISAQVERKIRALRCHESQHLDPDAMEERVRAWFRFNAQQAGLPDGSSAERFFVVDTR